MIRQLQCWRRLQASHLKHIVYTETLFVLKQNCPFCVFCWPLRLSLFLAVPLKGFQVIGNPPGSYSDPMLVISHWGDPLTLHLLHLAVWEHLMCSATQLVNPRQCISRTTNREDGKGSFLTHKWQLGAFTMPELGGVEANPFLVKSSGVSRIRK